LTLGLSDRHPTRSCTSCSRHPVVSAARARSTPFIRVDHGLSLPAITSTPRAGRRRQSIDYWFHRPSRRVSTHRQLPQMLCTEVALQTVYVPSRHMLPELERLINACHSSPHFPLFTRRPRTAYGSSNIHDANDPAPACGIDGLHKFPALPLATPTRTSLVSFEPFLPLLTCCCLLPFILLF
jgi:hypothetical protein